MKTLDSNSIALLENIALILKANYSKISDDPIKWIDTFRKNSYASNEIPYFQIGTKRNDSYSCFTGNKFNKSQRIELYFELDTSESRLKIGTIFLFEYFQE